MPHIASRRRPPRYNPLLLSGAFSHGCSPCFACIGMGFLSRCVWAASCCGTFFFFRLSLLSLGRSCTWHQLSHQPFRLRQLLISLHQHAFSLLSNMRLLQMKEGLPPALCLSKALLYKEVPPPQFHRCFRIVLLTGSVPLVVPPRDITNTTVVSTSQLHIKASRDVSRLCVKLRGPRPQQSPVLSSRLTQGRQGIGIWDAR